MRSSSTSSRRIGGEEDSARPRRAAPVARDNAAMPTSLRNTLLSFRDLLSRPRPFIVLAVALLASPTGCSIRRRRRRWCWPPAPSRAPTPSSASATPQILKGTASTVELRATRARPRTWRCCATRRRASTSPSCRAAPMRAGRRAATDDDSDDGLVSLGSLFYEPVWLFYRDDSAQRLRRRRRRLTSLAQLRRLARQHRRPGSGVPNLMAQADRGQPHRPATLTLLRKAQTPAVVDLLAGEIDALVFASAPESLMVQMLLQTPGIQLFDFAQAEAYCAPLPLPQPGDAAARRGRPGRATCRPPTCAWSRRPPRWSRAKRTHPALIQLFVQAAQQVHGGAGWFQQQGRLPERRATPSGRSPRRRSASTPAARRCCSATCRSGSPTWSTACGWCW